MNIFGNFRGTIINKGIKQEKYETSKQQPPLIRVWAGEKINHGENYPAKVGSGTAGTVHKEVSYSAVRIQVADEGRGTSLRADSTMLLCASVLRFRVLFQDSVVKWKRLMVETS